MIQQFELPPSPPPGFYPPPRAGFEDTIKVLRQRALDLMLPGVTAAVEEAWKAELPEKRFPNCRRLIGTGLREAIRDLSAYSPDPFLYSPFGPVWGLPRYWEPAMAQGIEDLDPLSRQAYRWAAAVVGLAVRNRLEDLHAKYTSDASMPALNQGVRNAVLAAMLQDPAIGYMLSNSLAPFVHLEDYLRTKAGLSLPAPVGLN